MRVHVHDLVCACARHRAHAHSCMAPPPYYCKGGVGRAYNIIASACSIVQKIIWKAGCYRLDYYHEGDHCSSGYCGSNFGQVSIQRRMGALEEGSIE